MLYTVTFNPSLDYYLKVNNMKSGTVNRAATERLTIGGKGINVALELKELGDAAEAFAFVGGFTGREIEAQAEKIGLAHTFLEADGRSRINVKIKTVAETDVNGTGVIIDTASLRRLVKALKDKLKDGDWVIICGSAPCELEELTYSTLIDELKEAGRINFVVDSHGKLLTETLRHKPFLIKPNLYELCEIFSLPPTIDAKIITAHARKLQKSGARNVIVSLGSDGAIMVTETDQAMYVRAARGQLVNSVGAGDCMIAGFIHEYLRTGNYFKSLNFATAAGSACAFTESIATREQIEYVESLML